MLGEAASLAVKMAVRKSGEELDGDEARLLSESLEERLPGIPDEAFLSDVDYTVGQLRELIKWLTEEPDANTVDGSTISPQEQLMEKLHTDARYDLAHQELKAEEVEQLLTARRGRILPTEEDLQKIARYESHLSRQMYQALQKQERQRGAAGEGRPAGITRELKNAKQFHLTLGFVSGSTRAAGHPRGGW